MGSGLRKGTGATPGCPILWGQGGNAGGLLLAVVTGTSGGLGPHSLSFPWIGLKFWLGWHIPKHMAPTLAPKALERAGVPSVGGAFLPIFRPIGVLSLVSTCCGLCAMASRCATD